MCKHVDVIGFFSCMRTKVEKLWAAVTTKNTKVVKRNSLLWNDSTYILNLYFLYAITK